MKRLTIVYTSTNPNTLGNACRLNMVRYLTNYFETNIITNHSSYIKSLDLGNEVISINNIKVRKGSVLAKIRYWRYIADQVNSTTCDGVFMFDGDAPSTIWIQKPVFQYVHQYGLRSASLGRPIKRIIRYISLKIFEFLKIKGLKKSNTIFVVSTSIFELLGRKEVSNLELITHAVDLELYRKPYLSEKHSILKELKDQGYFIMTYTGWCSENRGFQLLLDSIKIATKQEQKVILVIVGADKIHSDKILVYQTDNNLAENILNMGIVDLSLIPGILYYSDVCLSFLDDLPAFRISPPQKIVEYFAAGKPVICNKIDTHERLVSHSINGLILDYDANQLADACIYLKKNPLILAELSKNAINESKKYEIDTVYGKMVNSMKTVLNAT